MHVAVDEYSRVACVEILPDETPTPRSVGWFAMHGVRAREVISDGGSCSIAHDFARAWPRLGIKHMRTPSVAARTGCARGSVALFLPQRGVAPVRVEGCRFAPALPRPSRETPFLSGRLKPAEGALSATGTYPTEPRNPEQRGPELPGTSPDHQSGQLARRWRRPFAIR